jgi:hypothetical protein
MAKYMDGRESYYGMAGELLKGSKIFYVYCKTPTIFMSSQRAYESQRKFYEIFQDMLKKDIDIRYVFSLPLVKEDILAVARKDRQEALTILDEWAKTLENQKIKLKFIDEKNPYSFLVYDDKTIFLAIYPNKEKRGIIVFDNKEVPFFREFFDQIFQTASDDNQKAIEDIRKLV